MFTPHLERNQYRLCILEKCYLKPRKLKYKVEQDDKHICELVIHFKYAGSYHTTLDLIHPHEIEYVCKEVYRRLQEDQRLAAIKEEYIHG